MTRTFTLRLDDEEFTVESKGRTILINGKPFRPEIKDDTITVSSASHQVEINDSRAYVDGIAYRLETEGLERKQAAGLGTIDPATPSGDGAVTAIMPGLIIKVLAKVGDEVAMGDVLLILEAMKMESEICAPTTGVVKEVLIKAGDNVTQSQPLIAIE